MTPALRLKQLTLLRERDFRAAEVVVSASLACPGEEPYNLQLGARKMRAGDVWAPGVVVLPPSVHRAAAWSFLVSEIDPVIERAAQAFRREDLGKSATQLAAYMFSLQAGVVLAGEYLVGKVLATTGRPDELAAGAGWLFEGMPGEPILVTGPGHGPSAEAILEVMT